jgi:glycosyltransferase involved in cell wall biosynthesis
MNICLVSQEYPPETARGGIGTQTWNKARALTRLGHTVHVLTSSAKRAASLRTETTNGITVHRMQPPGFDFPVYTKPTYWLGYAWSVVRELNRILASTRFDIIDFAEYGAEGFAYQLDRTIWNWVPVVIQLHGPLAIFSERIGWPERDSDFFRVCTSMEDISIKHADARMACSSNIADFVAAFHGVLRESIDVVHCGVDDEKFRPPATDEPRAARPTVLFVGNIAANKGVNAIFEVVLRLRAKYPDIRLQILGKADDGQLESFQARARSLGAEDNFQFCGFVGREQLPEFYRRAHVFASPAQHEPGVANVYIEAMACACPVVASTTGGAPEAVVHQRTGLLVPPNDIDALAQALDQILGDPEIQKRMGDAGRRRVEDYFAMDKYIARVLAIYKKAIAQSRAKLAVANSRTEE